MRVGAWAMARARVTRPNPSLCDLLNLVGHKYGHGEEEPAQPSRPCPCRVRPTVRARQRARVGVRVRGRVGVRLRLRVRVRVRVRVTRAGRVTPHSTAAARRAAVGHEGVGDEPAPIGDGCGFEADEGWVDAVVGS